VDTDCPGTDMCVNNECVPGIASIHATYFNTSNFYNTVVAGTSVRAVNWTFIIYEQNGINWFIDGYLECWKNKPSIDSTFASNCKITDYHDNLRNATKTVPFTRNPTTTIFVNDAPGNIYNFTYFGHDSRNNLINASSFIFVFQ
jgi:hypothetical protein